MKFDEEFMQNLEILAFIIGVMNYDENLSQSDKNDILQEFDRKAEGLLKRIENDLEEQNQMLGHIIELLEKGD